MPILMFEDFTKKTANQTTRQDNNYWRTRYTRFLSMIRPRSFFLSSSGIVNWSFDMPSCCCLIASSASLDRYFSHTQLSGDISQPNKLKPILSDNFHAQERKISANASNHKKKAKNEGKYSRYHHTTNYVARRN